MNKTFLFYDLETTGLSPCFDQIMQFAAIRTDTELNEIERHEFYVKLNPDVHPAPDALITHHIGINDVSQGLSEIAAIEKIHHLFNTPNTISLGYNTLGFDDEFLRFSFYRNLMTPYTHQYANGCGRADIYPITVLYYLYAKDTLHWPNIDGKTSMKLELLSAENQLATGQAHNALVDVEATVALAKKLKSNEPLWQYALGYFNKATDIERINQLNDGLVIALDPKLGAKNQYQSLVVHFGQHQHYKNQSLWLRLDDKDLRDFSINELELETFCMKKRGGEAPIILPAKDRYLEKLSIEKRQLAEANFAWLQQNAVKARALKDYHQHFKFPIVEHIDLDAALYQISFPSHHDQRLFDKFHQAEPSNKSFILSQFQSHIYRDLGTRLIARHYPEQLGHHDKQHFQSYLHKSRHDYRGHAQISWQQCVDRCNELLSHDTLTSQQRRILQHYQQFLAHRL